MGHTINGRLASWDDVRDEANWKHLLLGNGFSMHLWGGFGYTSLFDKACDEAHLEETDQDLFEALDTENFEGVLSALSTAISVADALGDPTDHLLERYTAIQGALGEAVRAVHPPLDDVPYDTRVELRAALREYKRVFTTSYDLLLYWCTGAGAGGHEYFDGFKDCFWSNGRLEFDSTNADFFGNGATQVYYLHGALHLVVNGAGVTRKRGSAHFYNLLDQFGEPDPDDPTARPLLISEGDAMDKLRAIQGNDYLLFALKKLRGTRRPLVVFGHSLSDQDKHLVDALNRNAERPTAVGMLDRGQIANRHRQAEIRRALSEIEDVFFYDAATHPLGAAAHRIEELAA